MHSVNKWILADFSSRLVVEMEKNCKNCGIPFETTSEEKGYLEKMNVSEPTYCYTCRRQRRLAWRNERNLHKRKCDLSGKSIVSIYDSEAPFPVYDPKEWFTDKWDGITYGRDFDFNRPFFEQFKELEKEVPKMALHVMSLENSPYVNYCWHAKNCYLCFASGFLEDIYYSYEIYYSKDCADISFSRNLELCYYLLDCKDCFSSQFLQDCHNCTDSYFSLDCRNCKNVAFSYNLRNKDYHIYNKPVTKEEFAKFQKELKEGSFELQEKYKKDFQEKVIAKALHKPNHNINIENCTGDYLLNCKNCTDCYDCAKSEDMYQCTRSDEDGRDCMDTDNTAFAELAYDSTSVAGNNVQFGVMSLHSNDCQYFHSLQSCNNCFGCIGLRSKKYCILNKQYSKEDYEELRTKIIDHMKETGEWGEFFPAELSHFPYNETRANEHYPLSKEEAETKNYPWREKDHTEYLPQDTKVPDKIAETDESIIKETMACKDCGKNYKIIAQEFSLYKKLGIPIPRSCFNCRYFERDSWRSPYGLETVSCSECDKEFTTTNRETSNVCEDCYKKAIY